MSNPSPNRTLNHMRTCWRGSIRNRHYATNFRKAIKYTKQPWNSIFTTESVLSDLFSLSFRSNFVFSFQSNDIYCGIKVPQRGFFPLRQPTKRSDPSGTPFMDAWRHGAFIKPTKKSTMIKANVTNLVNAPFWVYKVYCLVGCDNLIA